MVPAVLQIVLETTNRKLGCISLTYVTPLTLHREQHHQEINGNRPIGIKKRISQGKSPPKKQNPSCLSIFHSYFLIGHTEQAQPKGEGRAK